jgi:hypothetical protein
MLNHFLCCQYLNPNVKFIFLLIQTEFELFMMFIKFFFCSFWASFHTVVYDEDVINISSVVSYIPVSKVCFIYCCSLFCLKISAVIPGIGEPTVIPCLSMLNLFSY